MLGGGENPVMEDGKYMELIMPHQICQVQSVVTEYELAVLCIGLTDNIYLTHGVIFVFGVQHMSFFHVHEYMAC